MTKCPGSSYSDFDYPGQQYGKGLSFSISSHARDARQFPCLIVEIDNNMLLFSTSPLPDFPSFFYWLRLYV